MSEKDDAAANTYTIRPPFAEKFNSGHVQAVLKAVICEELEGKTYGLIDPNAMSCHLIKLITKKLQDLPYKRYKYVVNVIIAEQRGQGVQFCSACSWDPDTDNVATHLEFIEDMYCIATVFGVYLY